MLFNQKQGFWIDSNVFQMKATPILLTLLVATAPLSAQQQEGGMLERIHNPKMEANRMQDKAFVGGGGLQMRSFNTGAFQGAKSTSTGEFKTRSFLGINNPWLGRKIYETSSSSFAKRTAREASDSYSTSNFTVEANSNANRTASIDAELPNSVKPRETVMPAKAQGGIDRFTQNLSDDLSIDQVRDLLNKGKQNR